jgi:16S rRNA (uracil1498-N3)-methyltransferase
VLDGAGVELLCEVSSTSSRDLHLTVIKKKSVHPPSCQVTLLQSIPKGKIIESIIQKATELGVYRIVPVLSERVVTRLEARGAEQKLEKWRHVAIEAIKQCGSAWLPRVDAPVTPDQFIGRNEKFELSLVGSLQDDARHPCTVFSEFRARHKRSPTSVCMWVGPEGDFTQPEIESIKAAGALPITLGHCVLRVETAAIYSLSILNYETQA